MQRVGLALSGGGFRATLYHLGVIRFLRDAEILPKVTHITSVSGGSILGAHLVLNWDKYCGGTAEFEQAADELIRFVKLDIRNRIVRRFPLASSVNTLRRWLRLGALRQLTRPGLLELQYERHLFGDIPLSQLPKKPRLHILATNLSEGCLCSFNSDGLILQRRMAGQRDRFESVRLDLATVSMAVAASSAFPGFFPPLELSGWDVGVEEGEYVCQAFTDGGVYDNLGLRMFRCIEQSWVRDVVSLSKSDFLELVAVESALHATEELPEQAPLNRLRSMLRTYEQRQGGDQNAEREESMIGALWEIIRSERLYQDEAFENVELSDASAESLRNFVRTSNREPELSDQLWLNRQILAATLKQVVGKPCLLASRHGFDAILVSDAGGKFKVAGDMRAGGLIKTALRSSDILMDRVWQLELEAFESDPGILFYPMSKIIEPSKDRWAPHPEIQRQTARIRTDLDRFSDLEISALIQHGYCVARNSSSESHLFDNDIPTGPPWDPSWQNGVEENPNIPDNVLRNEDQLLATGRKLQWSSRRRTWSTIFSFRDWPTFVWIPLLLLLLLALPYWIYELNSKARQQRMVLSAVAATSPVYGKILDLLDDDPGDEFQPDSFLEVETMEKPDFSGYEVLSDTRIVDVRNWSSSSPRKTSSFLYERLNIRRNKEGSENTILRFQFETPNKEPFLTCKTKSLNPVFSRMKKEEGVYAWELSLDFSRVPFGRDTLVIVEGLVSVLSKEFEEGGRVGFAVPAPTSIVQIWLLMPIGRDYNVLEMSAHPIGQPQLASIVEANETVQLPFGSIATFRFINPDSNYRYECSWKWTVD